MLTVWTKHLKTPKDKEDFEKYIRNSKVIFERLREILLEDKKTIDNTETSPRTYEIPNWDYLQADMNGYKRCLNKILRLIDLDQREQNK